MAVQWIMDRLERGYGPVADVGAGTGALSGLLVEQGCQVVAVEPVKAMVDRFSVSLARVQAVAAALPFPDRSLGAVTAATAFHWFATTEALDELHRCLSEGMPLILVWNERDGRVPWVAEHTALVDRFAGDAPRFATMQWRAVVESHPGFAESGYAELPNPASMSRQGLVDRILSTSFIAALAPGKRHQVRVQAERLAGSLPERFEYPYLTRMWCYRRY